MKKTMSEWLEMVNENNKAEILKEIERENILFDNDYEDMKYLVSLALKGKVEDYNYSYLDTIVRDSLADIIAKTTERSC